MQGWEPSSPPSPGVYGYFGWVRALSPLLRVTVLLLPPIHLPQALAVLDEARGILETSGVDDSLGFASAGDQRVGKPSSSAIKLAQGI